MMRYAGLYGNIKRPRIKSRGDNRSNINALDNLDLTDERTTLSTIDETHSLIEESLRNPRIHENIELGVDATIGNRIEAMGELSFLYYSTKK